MLTILCILALQSSIDALHSSKDMRVSADITSKLKMILKE